ncbi:MAG: hypothetical protein V1678_03725 [Candidatus Aenigmatarchaeota archaeon]
MGAYNCSVVNCGAICKTFRGLQVHIAKKHPNSQPKPMGVVTVVLPSTEKQKWEEIADKNSANLSEYVRSLVREELEGKRESEEQRKFKALTSKLENDNKNLELEVKALKTFFVQKMNKSRQSKTTKDTLKMIEHIKGFGKELKLLEEQQTGNKIIEMEWDTLTIGEQIEVRKLLGRISFVKAIKKIKKKCSKRFELFFEKELIE